MTPQEIFEYKMHWMPGHQVKIHSDLDWTATDWCKKNLKQWEWKVYNWTDVYEHTFAFEKEEDAVRFTTEVIDVSFMGKRS